MQVIEANVRLTRAQRNHAETRVAPPRIAPLALLIEGAVVVARDGGRRDEGHRTFAERLCEPRERYHARLLARRPRLHHLARREVQKTIRVDAHHEPPEVYDMSTGKELSLLRHS